MKSKQNKKNQNKMEKREIKLGDLRVVRSDLGLDFYTKDYIKRENEDRTEYGDNPDHIWLNEKGVQALKDWLNEEPKYKQIDYKDRSYIDKRRILRQLSIKDEISNFLDILTDEIYGNINSSITYKSKIRKIIDIESTIFYHYIKRFLVDGYLTFELIYKDSKLIGTNLLDPSTLLYQEKDGETFWIQHNNIESMKRVLFTNQVIYLSYSDKSEYYFTSYIEQLKESYEKFKMAESQFIFKGTVGGIRNDMNIKTVKWLEKNMNRVSMIPESLIKYGEKPVNINIKYNSFVNRIAKIFKEELLEKINKTIDLNK
jgi:hypothetical protein